MTPARRAAVFKYNHSAKRYACKRRYNAKPEVQEIHKYRMRSYRTKLRIQERAL